MDKRTLLAVALSLAVWIGWSAFMAPQRPPRPGTGPGTASGAVTPTATATPLVPGTAPSPDAGLAGAIPGTLAPAPASPAPRSGTPTAEAPATPAAPEEIVTLKSRFVEARLSSAGAKVTSLRLLAYTDEETNEPHEMLLPGGVPSPALVVVLPREGLHAETPWAVEKRGPGEVSFRSPPLSSGVRLLKTVRLSEDRYTLDVTLRFEGGAAPALHEYTLLGPVAGISPEDEGIQVHPRGAPASGPLSAVVGQRQGDGATIKLVTELAAKLPLPDAGAEPLRYEGNASFGGVASKYFAMVLAPAKDVPSPTLLVQGVKRPLGPGREPLASVASAYRVAAPTSGVQVPAGGAVEHRYSLFAGPKVDHVLAEVPDAGLVKLIDYTSIMPLAETLSNGFLWLLRKLQGLTGSWGVAIFLLTCIVRALVHPLSRASIKNMDKMQRLAPKVAEIQKKYEGKSSKEAEQKKTLEVMDLYRQNNTSPFLGCLPTLIQLPVFIGLYNSLAYSIELRRTEFLYIHDLSKPDRLATFGGANLPFFGGYFNLLPLLMVGTMILQQRMQPPSADPVQRQQQQMMQYMMVLFGALFYHVPAGLVLYFLTSSLLGMAEQKWVKSQLDRAYAAS